MNYRDFGKLGWKSSLLGMGCMRLPRVYNDSEKAEIDVEKAVELIGYAAENGINYFDTAFSYHNGHSEEVLGLALDGGLRKKVKIVTKQPLNVMKTDDDIRRNLESTLKKLRTDFLDVYLIHNINAASWPTIRERDIIGKFEKFKEEGLIGAVGFSYHGGYNAFSEVLSYHDWDMCQLQQNILDVNKEATEQAIHDAGKKGCALVIMEPLRGGGLAYAPPEVKELYKSLPEQRGEIEWAFRHLINYSEVSCILSGVTALDQLKENIEIFSKPDAVSGCLSDDEKAVMAKVKAVYESKASIPCTGCEYCMPCPSGINIPIIFSRYNEGIMFDNFSQPQRSYMLMGRANSRASNCVSCGACESKCPQGIKIIDELKKSHEALKGWIE